MEETVDADRVIFKPKNTKDQMKFSIITICYNSENTIERTIKSVLSQTYKDYEYIIVDGASNDSTINIIRKYEPLFNGRMKWKSEPDKGIYNAMNKGIQWALGDILGIVNSDDWLECDALERVSLALKVNNNDMSALYCGGINFHLTNGEVKKWPVNIKALHRDAKMYLVSGVRHPGLFVPKEIYDKVGVFNEEMKLSADADFMLRCYYNGLVFFDINAIVSNMTEGGISTKDSPKTTKIFQKDRKILLKSFGKSGIPYLWLYFTWDMRRNLKRIAKKLKIYK